MKLIRYTIAIAALTASFTASAQDYPPNAEPGKCYAKCIIPDEFENITEEILTKQATQRIEIVPAKFTEIEEKIEVKAVSTRIEIMPAIFETLKNV